MQQWYIFVASTLQRHFLPIFCQAVLAILKSLMISVQKARRLPLISPGRWLTLLSFWFWFVDSMSFDSSGCLFQCLQHPKEWCRFFDSAKFDAKGLHFDKQIMHIDDLVAYERLQEDAHQTHQAILHVLVLDIFTRGNAIGDVKMNELWWQVDRCGQSVHYLQRM